MIKSKKKVTRYSKLRASNNWSFRNLNTADTRAYSHSYHRYPAKFIPQLVRELIKKNTSENEVVCDPFGGCGTTLVEAKLLGRRGLGFDVNPIAKLIADTKTTAIKPITLENARDKFIEEYRERVGKIRNHHPRLNYWFNNEVLELLDELNFNIEKIKNPIVKRFFLCAYSHNLKNSSRWLMKSTKPTVDKDKFIADPYDSFMRHLNMMIRKNEEYYNELEKRDNVDSYTKMYRRNSTKRLPLDDGSIDYIVTSPPYVTSYDYADLHELSILWFSKYKKNKSQWKYYDEEYTKFRKLFVGTNIRKSQSNYNDCERAKMIVEKLNRVDKKIGHRVHAYFNDMHRAFIEMHRILKKDGKASIIIGNTKFKNVDILNAEVATDQMKLVGFRISSIIKREIPNKTITPWRDKENGRFTSLRNNNKKRAYQHEYILNMRK